MHKNILLHKKKINKTGSKKKLILTLISTCTYIHIVSAAKQYKNVRIYIYIRRVNIVEPTSCEIHDEYRRF